MLWQVRDDWPTLEFIRNAVREKYGGITRVDFLLSLVFEYHPFTAPVWIAGLVSLLAGRLRSSYRPVGLAWLAIFSVLLVKGHSRPHYLSGATPVLCAAGGVGFQEALRTGRRRRLRPLTAGLLGLGFAPRSAESERLEWMPQHIADQFGWRELVDATAAVCDRLSSEERARPAPGPKRTQ
jgi:hypothetical protein